VRPRGDKGVARFEKTSLHPSSLERDPLREVESDDSPEVLTRPKAISFTGREHLPSKNFADADTGGYREWLPIDERDDLRPRRGSR
jgi:hypothetical protein